MSSSENSDFKRRKVESTSVERKTRLREIQDRHALDQSIHKEATENDLVFNKFKYTYIYQNKAPSKDEDFIPEHLHSITNKGIDPSSYADMDDKIQFKDKNTKFNRAYRLKRVTNDYLPVYRNIPQVTTTPAKQLVKRQATKQIPAAIRQIQVNNLLQIHSEEIANERLRLSAYDHLFQNEYLMAQLSKYI